MSHATRIVHSAPLPRTLSHYRLYRAACGTCGWEDGWLEDRAMAELSAERHTLSAAVSDGGIIGRLRRRGLTIVHGLRH